MAQNQLDINPSAIYSNLITFSWGTTGVARYVNDARDFVDSGTFTSMMAMDINLKKQTGGAKDEECTITMPSTLEPIVTLLTGLSLGNILVTIEEVDVRNALTRRSLFKGYLKKIIGNKNGNDGIAEIMVEGLRARLEGGTSLGIAANNGCSWKFGDKSCKKDLAALIVSGVVTSVSNGTNDSYGKVLVTHASGPGAGYFNRGYIKVGDTRIAVRKHVLTSGTTSELTLVEVPPSTWAGLACFVVPGCDKLLETCRTTWTNEINFGGFGIAIPVVHPVYEAQG